MQIQSITAYFHFPIHSQGCHQKWIIGYSLQSLLLGAVFSPGEVFQRSRHGVVVSQRFSRKQAKKTNWSDLCIFICANHSPASLHAHILLHCGGIIRATWCLAHNFRMSRSAAGKRTISVGIQWATHLGTSNLIIPDNSTLLIYPFTDKSLWIDSCFCTKTEGSSLSTLVFPFVKCNVWIVSEI